MLDGLRVSVPNAKEKSLRFYIRSLQWFLSAIIFCVFFVKLSVPVLAAQPDACSLASDWEKYYKAYPTDENRKHLALAKHHCGIEYADRGQWNTAERYLTEAKNLDPENLLLKQNLAGVIARRAHEAFEANEFRLAQEGYEKALRYDPDNSQIKMALSQVLY